VPLGSFLPVAVIVFVAVVGRQGEVSHGGATAGVFQLRVLAAVPWAAGLMVVLVARRFWAKKWPCFEGTTKGRSNDEGCDVVKSDFF
jgi:hypothetical protein